MSRLAEDCLVDFVDFSGSLFDHKDFLGALSRFSVSLPAPALFKVNLAWKITFFFYLLEFKRGPIFCGSRLSPGIESLDDCL